MVPLWWHESLRHRKGRGGVTVVSRWCHRPLKILKIYCCHHSGVTMVPRWWRTARLKDVYVKTGDADTAAPVDVLDNAAPF